MAAKELSQTPDTNSQHPNYPAAVREIEEVLEDCTIDPDSLAGRMIYWFLTGKAAGKEFMLLVSDGMDYSIYPRYVDPQEGETTQQVVGSLDTMARALACYDLQLPISEQVGNRASWNDEARRETVTRTQSPQDVGAVPVPQALGTTGGIDPLE